MNKPTFKEQSEKIIQAYLKCEINPWAPCACFVGNLLNRSGKWVSRLPGSHNRGKIWENHPGLPHAIDSVFIESSGLYSLQDVLLLEKNFLDIIDDNRTQDWEQTEEGLFLAMVSTLEMLKQLHISKGEIIEEEVTLQKRQLV